MNYISSNGDLSELANIMELPISEINRIRNGERRINQQFIISVIKAFPDHKTYELFYFE